MINRSRFFALLAVLVLLVGAKLAQELGRFYGSREERIAIARLEAAIQDVGRGVIDTQLQAESLRAAVLSMDVSIQETRDQLIAVERRLMSGPVTAAEEQAYLRQLGAHNQLVIDRNGAFREWQIYVDSHIAYVEQYNSMVDSIRNLARTIGEPYYPVSTPAEIAAEERDDLDRR